MKGESAEHRLEGGIWEISGPTELFYILIGVIVKGIYFYKSHWTVDLRSVLFVLCKFFFSVISIRISSLEKKAIAIYPKLSLWFWKQRSTLCSHWCFGRLNVAVMRSMFFLGCDIRRWTEHLLFFFLMCRFPHKSYLVWLKSEVLGSSKLWEWPFVMNILSALMTNVN